MSITRTSLRHPTFKAKLQAAMREASNHSLIEAVGVQHVGSITIRHTRPVGGFRFIETPNRDITTTVLAALRES